MAHKAEYKTFGHRLLVTAKRRIQAHRMLAELDDVDFEEAERMLAAQHRVKAEGEA